MGRVGIALGVLVLFAALSCGGCGDRTPAGAVRLTLNGHTVVCEVADDEAERAWGLSHRESLGADRGMVFVYPDERDLTFWMKDTTIPLSIAFIAADGRILNIADMTPLTLGTYPSAAPARYALEVNRGWFEKHGVKAGDRVEGLPD